MERSFSPDQSRECEMLDSLPLLLNMSPQSTLATQQQSAQGVVALFCPISIPEPPTLVEKQSGNAKKAREPASPPENTQLHGSHSYKRLATDPTLLEVHQKPSNPPSCLSDLQPVQGPKRQHSPEDEHPVKQHREESQSLSEPTLPLTKANLKRLDRLTGSVISGTMSSIQSRPRKRTLSGLASSADMTQETPSTQGAREALGPANYRFITLAKRNIFVCTTPLPDETKSAIEAILKRDDSQETEVLKGITQKLCLKFGSVLRRSHREDDDVDLIHEALFAMDGNEKFFFLKKHDWLNELIPRALPDTFNFSHPRLKHLQGISVTPSPSQPAKPPSKPKTPRPDITVGLKDSTLFDRLKTQGLPQVRAHEFLRGLQLEQLLYSNPTSSEAGVRFPPIVVESKSYATGKNLFEAQNQAAVSGSCSINLQLQLDALTKEFSPNLAPGNPPLAFSICSEGPVLELWVHHTTTMDGVRFYNMDVLKCCHAIIESEVFDFLKMVNKVMSWATSEFLDEITKRLILIAEAIQDEEHAGSMQETEERPQESPNL